MNRGVFYTIVIKNYIAKNTIFQLDYIFSRQE
nr:MAG TPA: hypothetical protein [Caudoviricetes sp.]